MKVVVLLLGLAASLLLVGSALGTSSSYSAEEQDAILGAMEGRRLIEFAGGERVWLTEDDIMQLIRQKVHFMDVTDNPDLQPVPGLSSPTLPATLAPRRPEGIKELQEELSAEEIGKTITSLSNLYTRYYTSNTGVEAAQMLYDRYQVFAEGHPAASVRFFPHDWVQPSVIARIEGIGPNAHEVVIIGGHEDSAGSSSTGRSPGADDDASGSSSVLEVFRVLAKNGFRGQRSIEFHAYAAEEVGLLGSQAIASTYQKEGKIVAGMMQLDMVGYVKNNRPVFGLVTDFVSAPLTDFVRELALAYTDLPVVDTKCGYACSDHASWTRAGYASSFPFETASQDSSPYIHSAADTLETISTHHAREFAKVALAFAVELSTQ